MQARQAGQAVPDVTFKTLENEQWRELSSQDIFSGKNVVVFSLPGAFTPTCSSSHVPRYNELADTLREQAIDDIICISVNDCFTMAAWQAQQQADKLRFIPDGNGEFTQAMGLLVDKSELGFGQRSWRYSMLVKDGIIDKLFIEPEKPGDPFEVSDADTMLRYINPQATPPAAVTLITKEGCSHCKRAKSLLNERGMRFEEIKLGEHGISNSTLTAISGRDTVPQVFIDGKHIGGADDLSDYLDSGASA